MSIVIALISLILIALPVSAVAQYSVPRQKELQDLKRQEQLYYQGQIKLNDPPNVLNFVCQTLGELDPHCIESRACNANPGNRVTQSLCQKHHNWVNTTESKELREKWEQEQRRQYNEARQEQDRQEIERKAEFAKQRDVARLTYQKDVIAQVLNYSSTGNEDGSENSFWRRKESPCVYELLTYAPAWAERAISNLKGVGPILGLSGMPDTLDLNQLNFDEISFEMGRLPVGTTGIIIKHQGKNIIQGVGTRQMERLQRGWSLIYQQCPGVKKPF